MFPERYNILLGKQNKLMIKKIKYRKCNTTPLKVNTAQRLSSSASYSTSLRLGLYCSSPLVSIYSEKNTAIKRRMHNEFCHSQLCFKPSH